MQLVVSPDGSIRCVYDEAMDLHALGTPSIRRASHVEPTPDGQWLADLSPVAGPLLGPFARRSEALAAERRWIEERLQDLDLMVLPSPAPDVALTHDGSTLGTNAALRRLPKATPAPSVGLQDSLVRTAVDGFTAALSDNSLLQAADATAASLRGGEMLSVGGDLGTLRAPKNVRGRFHG